MEMEMRGRLSFFSLLVAMSLFLACPLIGLAARDSGYDITSSLWAKAVLQVSTSPVTLVWKVVGTDITPSGDQVISGYFYADPNDFAYGSQYNPELFVKIYIAKSGWCNIAFNHVTVDNVTVYSAHMYEGAAQQTGTAMLTKRLVEHQYNGVAIQSTPQANGSLAPSSTDSGYTMTSSIWAKAILQPSIGPVTLIWKEVGSDITPSGDKVVSGYFYADPGDFAYGSEFNPEIFVKIYIAKNGWCNIAFNHVTVDNVSIFSGNNYVGVAGQSGTATLTSRLLEHQYDGVELGNDKDTDDDGDGYTENQGDCNDSDAAVHPGAAEICGDGIDQDCNGSDLACQTVDAATVVIGTDTWKSGTAQNVIWLKSASGYAVADLQGSWATHELASAPGAPYWERGTVTIQSNGSFLASVTDSDRDSGTAEGTLQIASDGTITRNGSGNFKGNLDAGKTVMVITDIWNSNPAGTPDMTVMVKKGASYSLSDLQGSWAVHGLATGPGAPWWTRATMTVQSNGTFQAVTVESDGESETISGKFNMASDGTITLEGKDSWAFQGNLDAGKTVVISTETWDSGAPGTSEMKVWVKQAPTYSLSDLAGSWVVHGLASGESWWIRGTLAVQSNGAYQASFSEYDGRIYSPEAESGTLRITSDGIITLDGDGEFRGNIDKGN